MKRNKPKDRKLEDKEAEETYKNLSNDYPQDWRCWWGLYNSSKICKGNENSRLFADFSRPNEEYYINALKLAPEEEKENIVNLHDDYWRKYYHSIRYDDNWRCYYGPKPDILNKLEKEAKNYAVLCNKFKHKARLLELLINRKYDGDILQFCEIRKHSARFITSEKNLYDRIDCRSINNIFIDNNLCPY